MIECSGILSGILANCSTPLIMGVKKTVWIINRLDIVDYSPTNTIEIDTIDVSTICKIVGYDNSVMHTQSLEVANYKKCYIHSVSCFGFDISPETKENLEGAKNGLFTVVVENVDRTFEVFGLDSGMRIVGINRDPNNDETKGAFHIEFSSGKNNEPYQSRIISDWSLNFIFDDEEEIIFDDEEEIIY